MNARMLSALAILTSLGIASADSDFQWTFDNLGLISYTIESVSSSSVYDGPLDAQDPTITLMVGKRYEVTVVNNNIHPFQVIAKAASSGGDVILLSQGPTAGTLEGDGAVGWSDDGLGSNGKVEFTVTLPLIEAARAGGLAPGYRCGVHVASMRGDLAIVGEPVENPIAELIPEGTSSLN